MKKTALCLAVLFFLAGCSAEPEEMQRGLDLRSRILNASEFSFDADITADYGDQIHQFSMTCRADRQGELTFCVTQPQTIAGITGRIREDSGALIFDDTALHFDLLTDGQLSPVSAPWILVKTLRSGYLTSACREEEGIRLTVDDSYDDGALTLDIWLDGDDLPQRAEILYNGRRILTLIITNAVIS